MCGMANIIIPDTILAISSWFANPNNFYTTEGLQVMKSSILNKLNNFCSKHPKISLPPQSQSKYYIVLDFDVEEQHKKYNYLQRSMLQIYKLMQTQPDSYSLKKAMARAITTACMFPSLKVSALDYFFYNTEVREQQFTNKFHVDRDRTTVASIAINNCNTNEYASSIKIIEQPHLEISRQLMHEVLDHDTLKYINDLNNPNEDSDVSPLFRYENPEEIDRKIESYLEKIATIVPTTPYNAVVFNAGDTLHKPNLPPEGGTLRQVLRLEMERSYYTL